MYGITTVGRRYKRHATASVAGGMPAHRESILISL
jgi:hypothetical protein